MLVPLVIFLAVGLGIYAGFVKLAASILHYTVSWKSVFAFAAIMFLVAIVVRLTDAGQPLTIAIGHRVVVLFAAVIFGSWFFSTRGTDRSGTVLGWHGGIKLVGLAFAMIITFALAIAFPAQSFLQSHLTPPH